MTFELVSLCCPDCKEEVAYKDPTAGPGWRRSQRHGLVKFVDRKTLSLTCGRCKMRWVVGRQEEVVREPAV